MYNGSEKIDLHIHTTASDGTWSNHELMEQINQKNIKIFSITDHDTIANSLQMLKHRFVKDLTFVIGVEISTSYRGKEYHITAYNFDPQNQQLVELLDYNRDLRNKFNQKIIEFVSSEIDTLDSKEFLSYQYDRKRGGWNAFNFLLDNNVIKEVNGFFEIVRKSGEQVIFNDPARVIKVVKEAGGYPFLAHPSAYFQGEKLPEEIMMDWKEMGVSGIECYSPYLRKMEDAEYYSDFCQQHSLMISAGSDCHGSFNQRSIGVPEVTLNKTRLDFIK